MKFTNKNEAYLYLMFELYVLKNTAYSSKSIDHCIEQIKIAFEDHEQNPKIVATYLDNLLETASLPDEKKNYIYSLRDDLLKSDYQQSLIDRFENIIARRAESEFAVALLLHPTLAMMEAVGRISEEIMTIINNLSKDKETIDKILYAFTKNDFDVISLGAFEEKPSLDQVMLMLKQNSPNDLIEIMHIHFQFSRHILRNIPIKMAPREPIGQLATIIKEIWLGDPKEFFTAGLGEGGKYFRSYIANKWFCKSEFYTLEENRGRKGPIENNYYNKLSLLTPSKEYYEKGLPAHSSMWVPDAKNQQPDYSSRYVRALILNDAVYVSGPSGMTSLLLNQMELLGNFETIALKQLYLTASLAYIVGGGFHSIDEVLRPAAHRLDLVPGYEISLYDETIPPNYHVFIETMANIDLEILKLRELAWANLLNFFNRLYAPANYPNYVINHTVSFEPTATIENDQQALSIHRANLMDSTSTINNNNNNRDKKIDIFSLIRSDAQTKLMPINDDLREKFVHGIEHYIDDLNKYTTKKHKSSIHKLFKHKSLYQAKLNLVNNQIRMLKGFLIFLDSKGVTPAELNQKFNEIKTTFHNLTLEGYEHYHWHRRKDFDEHLNQLQNLLINHGLNQKNNFTNTL